jgi:hypothetical protein
MNLSICNISTNFKMALQIDDTKLAETRVKNNTPDDI